MKYIIGGRVVFLVVSLLFSEFFLFLSRTVLGGMVFWKIVSVLKENFEKSSPLKFDLFLWYFLLFEI